MVTNYETLQAEIERLTAEVSRLRDDRNCEKHMRKDAEERAHNAEAERDMAADAYAMAANERDAAQESLRGWLVENNPGGWIDTLRNELDAAKVDIGRLTYERDEAIAVSRRAYNETGALTDRTRKAEAERDAALADARRYRWLRDTGDATWRPFGIRDGFSAAQADAAIDAALAATGSRS